MNKLYSSVLHNSFVSILYFNACGFKRKKIERKILVDKWRLLVQVPPAGTRWSISRINYNFLFAMLNYESVVPLRSVHVPSRTSCLTWRANISDKYSPLMLQDRQLSNMNSVSPYNCLVCGVNFFTYNCLSDLWRQAKGLVCTSSSINNISLPYVF